VEFKQLNRKVLLMGFSSVFLAAAVVVGGQGTTPKSTAPAGDPQLNPQQQKYLKQLQAELEKPPTSPNVADQYLQRVQTNLQALLSVNTKPSPQTTGALAGTLVQSLNNGQLTVQQTVELSKVMAKALSLPQVDYKATNQLIKTIDPIVQNSGLSGIERNRLYGQVLNVIRSAPVYSPR
jgi:hypothetical protein